MKCKVVRPLEKANRYEVLVENAGRNGILVCVDKLNPGDELIGLFGDEYGNGDYFLTIDADWLIARRKLDLVSRLVMRLAVMGIHGDVRKLVMEKSRAGRLEKEFTKIENRIEEESRALSLARAEREAGFALFLKSGDFESAQKVLALELAIEKRIQQTLHLYLDQKATWFNKLSELLKVQAPNDRLTEAQSWIELYDAGSVRCAKLLESSNTHMLREKLFDYEIESASLEKLKKIVLKWDERATQAEQQKDTRLILEALKYKEASLSRLRTQEKQGDKED